MIETISLPKNKTARKEHKCSLCCLPIVVGTNYIHSVFTDGGVYQWKEHLHCNALVEELDIHNDCEEGVGENEFHNYVDAEFFNITNRKWQEDKTPFHDKLNLVLDHYKLK